ncbi:MULTISPECIES: hypothetical protein [Rhodococcus]|uniref:hypothetical protein n=1 Tax=Rhodococcus TaxID=1827 RepID=UPI003140B1FB
MTRGLEENITHFTRLGQHLDPGAQLAIYRPLDRTPASDTEARFPDLVGRLARTFTVTSPGPDPARARALGDRPYPHRGVSVTPGSQDRRMHRNRVPASRSSPNSELQLHRTTAHRWERSSRATAVGCSRTMGVDPGSG